MRKQAIQFARRCAVCLVTFLVCLAPARSGAANEQDPGEVVYSYIRAVYSRDFIAAYRHISSADRRLRDMDQYVRQRGAFSGFLLDAARQISESISTEIVSMKQTEKGVSLQVRYHVPDTKALAPILLNWDPYRLNGLSAADRAQILAVLQGHQREQTIEMITGETRFDLVKEEDGWRLFLDWAAGVKIPLRLKSPPGDALHATLSKAEVTIQPGDLFEVTLRVKNKTSQAIVARIGHLVEPRNAADYLEFVQCGFLLPVTIEGGAEEEYSGTYLLRGSLPEEIRELRLSYDFKILE